MSNFKVYISDIKYTVLTFVSAKLGMNYIAITYESRPNCKEGDIIDLVVRSEVEKIVPMQVLTILEPKPITEEQKEKINIDNSKTLQKILGPELFSKFDEDLKEEIEDNSLSWFIILRLPEETKGNNEYEFDIFGQS